jgi:hypothetical protein
VVLYPFAFALLRSKSISSGASWDTKWLSREGIAVLGAGRAVTQESA